MSTLSSDSLAGLSALIYEAAHDTGQWARACESIRQAFDCKAASLLIKQDGRFDRIHGDCDQYYSDLYWNDLMRFDPLQAGPAQNPRCSVYTDQSVLDKPDFLRSVIYNEWFAPQDMQGVLLLKVFDQQGVNTIFTLNRGTGQTDFNGHDIDTMASLQPVLQHAVRIRQHLARLRLDAHSSAFDQMHIAHLIVNRQRHVLHMNATADRLFSTAAMPVLVVQKRLDVRDSRDGNVLDDLISRACAAPGQARLPTGELVLHTERGPALVLSVYPLMDAMEYGLNAQYAASIVIRTMGIDGACDAQARLQNLFDLSAKEAELAMLLLTGCSLQEAAEQRAVRITTLRSQLASLFRKTGTARQGQLVALLARLC
ncbi:helix-turn-helix transcriptional regulator [Candidimonas nitroreducens]|uniref:HTH luxR-type domain-containing protein n=1 Tax=Candidimonas nitroreducens TaxID=683354 RepID=A0A225MR13_9BURK|nr:helix-turn-helix transcriptional regulator [Candidimonas nitroreducens]OWT61901.1 hypothetical protein CEY11_08730 [Candidimonas nitroreducens]